MKKYLRINKESEFSGIVSTYLPAALGSNRKHNIYAQIIQFQITYLSFELECEKNENKQKSNDIWVL